MRIAMIQMPVVDDKAKNIETALNYIKSAAESGADIAVLPEMFNSPYADEYFRPYSEKAGGETFSALSRAAKENNIIVVGGSIPELDGEKLYNTCFIFDESGKNIACHRKAHLFDIDVPNGQRFFESNTFSRGEQVTVFDTKFGKIGVCICFDMRFPELSRCMALKGAKTIIVPAAFNMTTGPAHWELMFRQRAVDNQLFTIGVSPARDENGCYVAYGNSIACDPWGRIIERADAAETMLTVDIDLSKVDEIRAQLPLMKSLRKELYLPDIENLM